MRIDAVFNSQVSGYWIGKTRAGVTVKLKANPEVNRAIENAFAHVVIIEISKEAIELANKNGE